MKTICCPNAEELARVKLSCIWYSAAISLAGIGFALLQAPRTDAEVLGLQLNGSIQTTKSLVKHEKFLGGSQRDTELCSCFSPSIANLFFPDQTNATIQCGDCILGNADLASVRASLSATLSGSVSTNQTIAFKASGNAHVFVAPNLLEGGSKLQADLVANAAGGFTVVDKAETITISKSISGSGSGMASLQLIGAGQERFYGIDFESGLVLFDTLPQSLSLPPGNYDLLLNVKSRASTNIASSEKSPLDAKLDVTLSITVPRGPSSNYHWKNAAGGPFGTASNWDPQRVPDWGAIAIFDLPGNISSPVPIQTGNNTVGELHINHMPVHFAGPLRVIGEIQNDYAFSIGDSGSLVLDSGATFETKDASIGDSGTGECIATVSGTGTKWTMSGPDALFIGNKAPGKIMVESDATLNAENGIAIGKTDPAVTAGTLRIESGALVTSAYCAVNKGSLVVDGASQKVSQLKIDSSLDTGADNESGTVVIDHGGKIVAGGLSVTGPSQLNISGLGFPDSVMTPSSLILTGNDDIDIAGDAIARIEVKDGAMLSTSQRMNVGAGQHLGKLLVHGKGSADGAICSAGAIYVGSQKVPSELHVEDGGRVTSSGLVVLGRSAGDIGIAVISGIDSSLSCDLNALWVGVDGRGDLTISEGAHVHSKLGQIGISALAPSTIPVPNSGGLGAGIVTISGSPVSPSEWHITGFCAVGADEPGTILLEGVPFLGGATLLVDGLLRNYEHGVIAGFGTVTASSVNNSGLITPGLSPGLIVINGNYEQTPNGAIRIEVAGLDAGKFDVLEINGDATLAGRLELAFIQGFVPKTGDTVEFLKVNGKTTGSLDVIPLIIPADSSAARPAMLAQAKLTLTPDGKGSLTVTDVRPTVQLNIALDLVASPGKANLSFTPIAGSNHFLEFRDGLAAGSTWQQFPGAPHNSGAVSDSTSTTTGRFYRVRVED